MSSDNAIEKINSVLENQYVAGALTVFLIVYASMAAPKLPDYLAKLFDYTLTKLVVFFLIVYMMKKNATVALVAAVALMITLMTLERIKFSKEMMEVVGETSELSSVQGCMCDRACNNANHIKPQTEEGHLVIEEVKDAVKSGELHPVVAQEVANTVVQNEINNIPVLSTKTQEGNMSMNKIVQAEETGLIGTDDAKKMAAKVVVGEIVAAQSNGLLVDEAGEPINYEMMTDLNGQESQESQESQELQELQEMSSTAPSMADLAEEVLRRKDEETFKRGGNPPSPEDIKTLCASVLNEYKNSPTCGTDCASRSNMLVNTSEQHNEILGNDSESSYYAPLE